MKALQISCDYIPGNKNNISNETFLKKVNKASQHYKNPSINYINYNIPELKPDEVKIRVKKVGLCGSDYHCIETNDDGYILFSGPAYFPQIPGHEFSGIIEEVGDLVTQFKPGDFVTTESIIWCGTCLNCRNGNFAECSHAELIGLTKNGALTKFINVPQKLVWKINDMLEVYTEDNLFNLATLFEPIGCAYKGIFCNCNKIYPGATASVYGAGPIGLAAAWLLKLCGVSKLFLFEVNKTRIEIAKSIGFKNVIDISNYNNPAEFLLKETHNYGIDITVECSGDGKRLIPEIIKSKSTQGTIIYLSRTGNTEFDINFDSIISRNNFIIGSRGHAKTFNYIKNILLNKETSYIMNMITKKIKFDDVKEFLDNKEYINECKVIVEL